MASRSAIGSASGEKEGGKMICFFVGASIAFAFVIGLFIGRSSKIDYAEIERRFIELERKGAK